MCSFSILSANHIKIPSVFIQFHLQTKKHFINAIFRRVKPFAAALELFKGATVHDQTCPCVQ
jgi:hypothetical protein